MRTRIICLIGLILAVCAGHVFVRLLVSQQMEIARLESNCTAMADELSMAKTSDGLKAYTVKRQTETIGELKRLNTSMAQRLHELKIRLSRAESVTQVGSQGSYVFKVDTVWIQDSIPTLRHDGDWIEFSLVRDTATVVTRDSLLIVRHGGVRRFLWWRWRRYTGEMTVTNFNPHVEIMGIKTIDLE